MKISQSTLGVVSINKNHMKMRFEIVMEIKTVKCDIRYHNSQYRKAGGVAEVLLRKRL